MSSHNPWGATPPADIEEAVYQSVGAASVCWESMSGTGVFQDDEARTVADRLLAWIEDRYDPKPDAFPVADPDQLALFALDSV